MDTITHHPEVAASRSAVDEIEEHVLRLLDGLAADTVLAVDKRWLAAGRTDIEKGFMAVVRSIEKPARFTISDPEELQAIANRFRRFILGVPQKAPAGWVIEREDSSPLHPFYYSPDLRDGHAAQWSSQRTEAIQLTRKVDAERLARALGVQVRITGGS